MWNQFKFHPKEGYSEVAAVQGTSSTGKEEMLLILRQKRWLQLWYPPATVTIYPVHRGSGLEFCITLSGVQSSGRGQEVLFHPKAVLWQPWSGLLWSLGFPKLKWGGQGSCLHGNLPVPRKGICFWCNISVHLFDKFPVTVHSPDHNTTSKDHQPNTTQRAITQTSTGNIKPTSGSTLRQPIRKSREVLTSSMKIQSWGRVNKLMKLLKFPE